MLGNKQKVTSKSFISLSFINVVQVIVKRPNANGNKIWNRLELSQICVSWEDFKAGELLVSNMNTINKEEPRHAKGMGIASLYGSADVESK